MVMGGARLYLVAAVMLPLSCAYLQAPLICGRCGAGGCGVARATLPGSTRSLMGGYPRSKVAGVRGLRATSDGSREVGASEPKVGFRREDVDVLREMSAAEAKSGNATGAAVINSIANRLDSIMQRSNSRMTAVVLDKEPSSGKGEITNLWPYRNENLRSTGGDLWRTSGDSPHCSARMLNSFDAEQGAVWTVKINELKGTMYLGLTSIDVDLDADWNGPGKRNQAFYITQNGNLFNGDQLVYSSGRTFAAGDTLQLELAGDGLYVSINGEELLANIKPITGTVRFSALLSAVGDGLTVEERVVAVARPPAAGAAGAAAATAAAAPAAAAPGSVRNSVTLSRTIDDDESSLLLSRILGDDPAAAPSAAPSASAAATAAAAASTPRAFLDSDRDAARLLRGLEGDVAEVLFNNADAARDSHATVRFDAEGYADRDRFVYVDEQTCIGCTNCATVARNTFYMNDDFGRARVFRQDGDAEEVIKEAVDTCPVDCIWYVSWDDLVTLEKERKTQFINPTFRLVGGNFIETSEQMYRLRSMSADGKGSDSKASIMKSGGMRCSNCPGKGCKSCPLYGVGQNPEYLRKKQAREARKKIKSMGGAGGLGIDGGAEGFGGDLFSSSFTDSSSSPSEDSTTTE